MIGQIFRWEPPMDQPMTLALLLALVGSLVLMTVIVKKLEKSP
jgi:hypothetical protein